MGKTIHAVKQLGYLLFFSVVFTSTLIAQADNYQCSDKTRSYTVVEGDNLYNIAKSLGDYRFWEYIYIANADDMDNPHLIYPRQSIKIPSRIAEFSASSHSVEAVLNKPFCANEMVNVSKVKKEYLVRVDIQKMIDSEQLTVSLGSNEAISTPAEDERKLEEFREAFQKLVEAEKAAEKKDLEPFRMEVDGMVLDETISKIGRDFYNVFYQYWSPPEEAYNYTITITEKPAPSLGTIVSVKINDTYTYQSRLQPRFQMIEDAGKDAVRYSYSYLQRNKDGLTIY
ncbi:CsgE family curli-type amyloid fiber assembly protein [Gracilimonas sp. Q87]|uniref:CsgE family curli-type amyloid fiber assembly protein n=1 Tax=Gracilimonas sp. Q87 TaxID=3384766 RepID=UPI00398441ED